MDSRSTMAESRSVGFDISVDRETNLVVVTGRGFWTTKMATACEVKLRDATKQLGGRSWKLLLDCAQLLPQSAEVQAILRNAFRVVHDCRPQRVAAVVANGVTMLQLKRLWAESGREPCSFVGSASAARTILDQEEPAVAEEADLSSAPTALSNEERTIIEESEVRRASDLFYAALNRVVKSDGSQMPVAWWHDDQVTTTHPMGGWAVGWKQVSATWDELSKTLSEGVVEVTDFNVFVHGEVAYTTGIEHVTFTVLNQQVRFQANTTNIYAKRGGQWKIIHHHPDRAPAAEDAIADG
jgi:ketosteroid isomerase-like protein